MTKRSRRLLLLAAVAILVALAGAVVSWRPRPRSAINSANAAKIELGMTLADVEALLGGPERDECPECPGFIVLPEHRRPRTWHSYNFTVDVYLGLDGRVRLVRHGPDNRTPDRPADRLRRWLRL